MAHGNVYFTRNGSKYHYFRDCPHLANVDPARVREEADVPALRECFGGLMAPAPSKTRDLCTTCAKRDRE